jgi:hypothetical protein
MSFEVSVYFLIGKLSAVGDFLQNKNAENE